MESIFYTCILIGATIVGLYLANLFYDYKIPHYISRKIGHMGGGIALLLAPFLFDTFHIPILIAAGFAILLIYARLFKPYIFRGIGGSGRPESMAEIYFPIASILLMLVGWGIFGNPWLAIVPLSFMAFGDAITGLIREKVYGEEVKGFWGSVGMLVVCLLLAIFMSPYWIGAVGAVVATIVEKYTPTTKYIDDNLTIPLVSGLVMGFLLYGG